MNPDYSPFSLSRRWRHQTDRAMTSFFPQNPASCSHSPATTRKLIAYRQFPHGPKTRRIISEEFKRW